MTLDFTEAVITQPVLPIEAEVGAGVLRLVIKPGIVVDMDEVSVRSGKLEVRAPWGQDASVLRIQVSGRVGSGIITARPRRSPRPAPSAAADVLAVADPPAPPPPGHRALTQGARRSGGRVKAWRQ